MVKFQRNMVNISLILLINLIGRYLFWFLSSKTILYMYISLKKCLSFNII